jgi:4,5:9,10-diseco-3-hydroxy-5,9,17-trioxoandrosta-1(10),2-diene-4-oate hydrolase
MWRLILLVLVGCAPVRVPDAERFPTPPRRLALAVAEPHRLVEVDGVALAVHDSSPDSALPVLLCLHAIGHGGGDFANVEAALHDSYRIIAVDWPGHGASGVDASPASALRYTTLLEGLVRVLELKLVVLLGNSIGGAVAVRFAALHPELVRAVILCNPGGMDPGGLIARLFIGHLVAKFHEGVEGHASFKPWFDEYYRSILVTDVSVARRTLIVEAGYESAAILEQAWRSFAQPEADQRALAATLKMPVLVAWASRDGLIQWSRNREAIEAIPGVKVVQLEAGHTPFLETPAEFLAVLTPFLATLR